MGQSISIHLTRAREQGHQEDTIEQLRLIQEMLVAKCEAQAKKMKEEAFEDKSFPAMVAVVGQAEKFLIRAENVASEEIERHINGVFPSEFVGGFINIVSAVVNELLEDASATEQERSGSHVVFANSSFLRVNYYLYKYEFSSKDLKAKFKNAVCYILQVGVVDIINTDSDLVIEELNSTIGSSAMSVKLSMRIHQKASFMGFLHKQITHLQSVFGVENKSMLAFENILRYLLNLYQIAVPSAPLGRSVRPGVLRGTSSAIRRQGIVRRPRNPSPFFPLAVLRPNPNLCAAPQLTERLEPPSVPSFGRVQERERRKRKEKLKRQKERDKKADWEEEI